MCDIIFEKATDRDEKVNRTSVYAEARSSRPKGSLKKGAMRNFAEFTRKHLCRNLFFNKVKPCGSAISLKTSH